MKSPRLDTARLDPSVRTALARAVAGRSVSDDVVREVSDSLVTLSKPALVRKFDICTVGICIDYFVDRDRWGTLGSDLLDLGLPIKGIHFFPWGIVEPDAFHVSVEVEVGALAGIAG